MKTAIKLCLWILAFVPLIVDHNVFYPYTSGKNLLIESCLVLAGILILINFFYSRDFREEMVGKAVRYLKHPPVLSVLAFVSVFVISTIFAVDKFAAFWGDLNRAEGLAGLVFFFSFFTFSLLTFEKKDWLWFFKLSLFASVILLGKEFVELFSGLSRPGSFTGNPTFLAGYLLFSITSAFVVISEVKNIFWRYFSVLIIILSIAGIFIAQTRGTILGLGLGIIVALIYFVIKGKNLNYKIFNLRKIAIVLLMFGIIFSGVFFVTRKNEVWQKVPGLSRLAVVGDGNGSDISTPVRLYLYKSSIASVNPMQNSWGKLLLGWGPDNFIIAESQNYNPALYNIEPDWHDRAHNKFLDVLVMNGLLGLLAYLAIWLLLLRYILKQKEFSLTIVGLLVFASSYLTHLIFVFDTTVTSIPFFIILAFIVYSTTTEPVFEAKKAQITLESKEKGEILTGTFLTILTLFSGYILFTNTLPGYMEMRNYSALISDVYASTFESKIDSVFTPFTVAQKNIRVDFLRVTNELDNKKPDIVTSRLLTKAISEAEEYVIERPGDFGFLSTLADFYNKKGSSTKNNDYLKKGEMYFSKILQFAPNRPDMNRKLAVNLLYQGKYSEAFDLYEKTLSLNSIVIGQDKDEFETVYTSLFKYFYENKDKANFIKVANRLKANNYSDSVSLDKILDYLKKNNTFPKVNFE